MSSRSLELRERLTRTRDGGHEVLPLVETRWRLRRGSRRGSIPTLAPGEPAAAMGTPSAARLRPARSYA